MTELATREVAASRAAHIRAGIGAYLTTLAHISTAYAQRDWAALGYESWDAYVNGEYSEHRLKLSPEHRQKAVAELRLAGMSTRAIGSALGVDAKTVRNDLNPGGENSPPAAPVTGADGKSYAPSRPISLGQSPTQIPTVAPSTTVTVPAELPGQQDLADVFLSAVDDLASAPAPHEIHTVTPLDFHDIAADTVQRWRLNFATARLKARELTTFDPERINEVHSGNWDREVGDILGALETWIAQVRDARRDQQKTKLRLVGGGRA